ELGEAAVSDVRQALADKNDGKMPASSTISTMLKILFEKKFATRRTFGRTHVYRPGISKNAYSKRSLQTLVRDYFGGSANRLVSFLVKEKDLSLEELNALAERLDQEE
ncbi:MAG: BlaI/MecI/CopY family transcriptional regulator, partial [Bacteroidota bacterium]